MTNASNGDYRELQRRAERVHTPAPQAEDIHTLLSASVEKIAQGWVDELTALRDNTTRLESLLMAHVASTKANIAKLHELGGHIAAEAERGRQVCDKLAEGIEQLTQAHDA